CVVLGVRHRALQRLVDQRRRFFWAVGDNIKRCRNRQTLDLTRDFTRLERRNLRVLICRSNFHCFADFKIAKRVTRLKRNPFLTFLTFHHLELTSGRASTSSRSPTLIFSFPDSCMTAPQIRSRTSTTRNFATTSSPRFTRSGIPIFTLSRAPKLPTTNDHSSFTLMTLPS